MYILPVKKSGIEADTISLFQKNIRIRKLVVPEQGVEKLRKRVFFNPSIAVGNCNHTL